MYKQSIKSLYPLALAEGEGVGTAYEYFAKRLQLESWLDREQSLQKILVAGLPEKYGSSLDFLLLASETKAAITVIDDRPPAVQKARDALTKAQEDGSLNNLRPEYQLVEDMGKLAELSGPYDLILSSETVQRITAEMRLSFISRLLQLAPRLALFVPNDDNPAHTNQSGLTGLRLEELQNLITQSSARLDFADSQISAKAGYIDMPPFPPGITRTEEQREHATSGKGEAVAMWGLGYFARLERFFPRSWRRSKAHIVYALVSSSQR